MWNKIQLIGNVGNAPEVRVLDGGTKVAKFRLATSERFKNQDGSYREQTEWHNIEMWGNLADIADKFVGKGDKLFIEGALHYREYTNRDGVKCVATTITAKDMKLLTPKSEKTPSASGIMGREVSPSAPPIVPPLQSVAEANIPIPADDLPF